MKEKRTQLSEILKYLESGKTLTNKEAMKKFGAMRLGSVIHLLRKRGHNIITINKNGKNRYGNRCTYAVYKLIPKEEAQS